MCDQCLVTTTLADEDVERDLSNLCTGAQADQYSTHQRMLDFEDRMELQSLLDLSAQDPDGEPWEEEHTFLNPDETQTAHADRVTEEP